MYKSTNTDAAEAPAAAADAQGPDSGVARYSVYLLYWYKSTNTDAEGAARARHASAVAVLEEAERAAARLEQRKHARTRQRQAN